MLDVKKIKADFPIFKTHPELIYLDSTSTSLKPQSVIHKTMSYYRDYSANIHRGIYKISDHATEEFEGTRNLVAEFINAPSPAEIIFTRGTTESMNLIVYALGRQIIEQGDEIVTTIMEHHSNFVPWQQLAIEKKATLKIIDIDESGILDSNNLDKYISKKTKILAITYISNVLGTINPIKEIIINARKINPNIIVIVDAAQASPHHKLDVQDLDCDFLAFSGHKMLGPTGIGILWGRQKLLDQMKPFNYGGDMVEEVYIDKTIFHPSPSKFEAGTPHIAGVIGMGAAIEYLNRIGLDNIASHENRLIKIALNRLNEEFGEEINILGPDFDQKVAIATFTFNDCHPHDLAQLLDEEGIAVRIGFHCAMPLHTRLKAHATTRASFYLYNDEADVENLIEGLKHARRVLA